MHLHVRGAEAGLPVVGVSAKSGGGSIGGREQSRGGAAVLSVGGCDRGPQVQHAGDAQRSRVVLKSRRYSVTLGRLRQARRDYTRRTQQPAIDTAAEWADQDQELENTTLVIGSCRFAGMGWLTSGDAALAAAAAARARDN